MSQKRWVVEMSYCGYGQYDKWRAEPLEAPIEHKSKESALEFGHHIAHEHPNAYVRIRRTDETKAYIIHWPWPDEYLYR